MRDDSSAATAAMIDDLLKLVTYDPWALTTTERRELSGALREAQKSWLPRLRLLSEPPEPSDDFPAFLLETPAFAFLRKRIGPAADRYSLDTATADLLQRFVDRYRHYLVDAVAN